MSLVVDQSRVAAPVVEIVTRELRCRACQIWRACSSPLTTRQHLTRRFCIKFRHTRESCSVVKSSTVWRSQCRS
eukprot:3278466-Karenia_brevis.AAC.1